MCYLHSRESRISRSGWSDPILQTQRALLNFHAKTYSWIDRPVTLSNKHTLNVVVATSLQTPTGPTAHDILVLLHGWGAGLAFYARTLRFLAPSFRAIYLIDLPGMAASSRPPFPSRDHEAAVNYFLSDLSALHDHLCTTDPIFSSSTRYLAAHSLGAYIAAEWLIREPHVFRELVLISPIGVPRPPDKPNKISSLRQSMLSALWSMGMVPQDLLRVLPRSMAKRYCSKYIPSPCTVHTLSKQERRLMVDYCYYMSIAPCAGERAASTILSPGAWAVLPLHDRLPHLAVPCSFIYGDCDWVDWRAAQDVRRLMSTTTTVALVEKADHNVFIDNPEGFATAVMSSVGFANYALHNS